MVRLVSGGTLVAAAEHLQLEEVPTSLARRGGSIVETKRYKQQGNDLHASKDTSGVVLVSQRHQN